MTQHTDEIDLSALVDIISNVAGMMILMACMAIVVRAMHKDDATQAAATTIKPISYPMSYISEKRSMTLCLKYNRMFQLPEKEALIAISERTRKGEAVEQIVINKDGVEARVEMVPTFTGLRFSYVLRADGGMDMSNKGKVAAAVLDIMKVYPPDRFFYDIHTWPECFDDFRELREFIHDHGGEVGWRAHYQYDAVDISYSVGEYSEYLSSIKAQ
jgi:hypothetical protein